MKERWFERAKQELRKRKKQVIKKQAVVVSHTRIAGSTRMTVMFPQDLTTDVGPLLSYLSYLSVLRNSKPAQLLQPAVL